MCLAQNYDADKRTRPLRRRRVLTGQGRWRVLIAEDDAVVRHFLAESIRGEQAFELVGAATDATEAIALAAAEQPDVVLLDVRMPGGGGLAAAAGIRRRSPGSKMIALSGDGDRAAVFEMLQAGVAGSLVKGGSIDEIIQAIKRAPDGRGSLSPSRRRPATRWASRGPCARCARGPRAGRASR